MTRITVGLGDRSYDIIIETGLLTKAGTYLKPFTKSGRIIIVTDANVAEHHLATLTSSCATAGITIESVIVPPGEGTKNWAQLEGLCDQLLDLEIERSEAIVALGGGKSTRRSAGKPRSTPVLAKTLSGRSINPHLFLLIPRRLTPCRSARFALAMPKSSNTA
jgi:hypothetical protein